MQLNYMTARLFTRFSHWLFTVIARLTSFNLYGALAPCRSERAALAESDNVDVYNIDQQHPACFFRPGSRFYVG